MNSTKRVCALAAALWIAGCKGPATHSTDSDHHTQSCPYPSHWWESVPEEGAAWWEVLPQAAGPGEVIVSKRNELGLLSNFAATPFLFHGQRYTSLEGFWQMIKYPETSTDPRATLPGITWKYTREEVSQMVGADAKAAGELASKNMNAMGIDWITFEGRQMKYWTPEKGEHYRLIVEATRAKVDQNPKVREVLMATGDLILRPDHLQAADAPPAWRYCEILMMIRAELRAPTKEGQGGTSRSQ
ncbi:MAG: NADAR family protein [Phycisphaerae bacterium]|nr:NADAR family protein [Phycisphaerae bacterium]